MGSPLDSDAARVLHPYYPLNAPLDHFAANETPVDTLLLFFGGILSCVVIAASAAARMGAKRAHVVLTVADHLSVAWFALCGFLHCFFEGYFIFNHARLASLQTLFAQLWKEYSLSDSRYLTSDPFMLSVESFTVFVWGPLCWVIVASIALRSSLRRPLSIVMCVGHLYGVALYYSTSLADHYFSGVSHSRPEFLYFWVYYVGLNGPWVVVPALLLYQNVFYVSEKPESAQELTQKFLENAARVQAEEERIHKMAETLHKEREELFQKLAETLNRDNEEQFKKMEKSAESIKQETERREEEAGNLNKIAENLKQEARQLKKKEERLKEQEEQLQKQEKTLQKQDEMLKEIEKWLQEETERLAEKERGQQQN